MFDYQYVLPSPKNILRTSNDYFSDMVFLALPDLGV